MVKKPEVLAIIPARGGSKSIPRKNIKLLSGFPLIAYSIAAGLQAKLVTRVIISTDDQEIARVARKYGAEVPFIRPKNLAEDDTPDLPVFAHALKWLEEHEGYKPDVIVQLRPTSPIRPPKLVDHAIKMLLSNSDADSVRGVVPAGQNPHKMWRLADNSSPMKNLLDVKGIKEPYNAPRQILPPVYWQTGHIDAIRPTTILKGSMSGKNIYPLIIDPSYTADIDNLVDWGRCEHVIKTTNLDIIRPNSSKRQLPKNVRLVVLDFDGVMTDGRVWVDGQGNESVAVNRRDGLGIARLKKIGIEILVLSTETNPVVAARCKKLKLPFEQGLTDKAVALKKILTSKHIAPGEVVYLGDDLNDLTCFPLVGCAVAVADAAHEILETADVVLSKRGGHGAVRELCDLLIHR